MTDPGPQEQAPQRVVTWRAVLVGALCVVFISIGAPFGSIKMRGSYMALDFSLPAAVFTMFLLSLLVSLVRVATRGRSLLNRSEMLVAYSMMAVATAICTMGLTAYILPMLGTPVYYASPENRWQEVLLPKTPEWIMLSREGVGADVIRFFYEGWQAKGITLVDVVATWGPPLGYWGIFLLALYATSISLMAIFRKQWVEDERIVFPLVQLPMELAGQPEKPGDRVTPLFKSKLLWIGFAVPFIFCTLKALPAYFPYLADIRPTEVWRFRMLQDYWDSHIRISWQTLGLAYLLSSDVALCVWLFGLLGSFYGGFSKFINFESPEKLGIYGAAPWPDLGHFGMGAMIALVFLRLWIGRRHLISVARKAFFLKTDADDSQEPMSYATAFWTVVVGVIVMTVWLCLSGMPLHVAILILFGAFIGFVGLTRVISESGMPVSIVPLVSSDFVVSAIGTSAIGEKGLLALPWTYVWNGDVRTFVMCAAAQGMRGCSERNRSYRGVFFAMMLAVILAIVVSTVMILNIAYEDGGVNLNNWFFCSGPQKPFLFARSLISGEPRGPNVRGWVATGIGAGAMILLTVARHSFVGWPINPVGLPISAVVWTQYLWFSVFLAWLVKTCILKYGGPRLYLKLRPLFLGIVLGQYAGAAFWIAIDGITGTTGNQTFWI